MSRLGGRRTLGPIKSQLGGDSSPSAGGGGGGSLTINNNIAGNMLKSDGSADEISGISALRYESTYINTQTDFYISGSQHNLYLQGEDHEGNENVLYRMQISGGILMAVKV